MKCTKACIAGNPNRGEICQCQGCKGKAHGSVNINFDYLEEILDRKLIDPNLGKADFRRYQNILNSVMANNPRSKNLRRVA